MAKKIKFALEMNGVKIRTMEELQENFELDAAVQYLLDGKLLTWLDDRFYEDEAEKIAELDKNAPNMKQQLCEILGVECEDDSEMDVDELERLNEKKRILKTMTDDEDIIANADKTALDQEDLSNLLNAGADTIYLCGDNFTVPIKFNNKKYIGILGKPSIKIKATTDSELEDKGIVFKNVLLPWKQENDIIPSSANINTPTTSPTTLPINVLKTLLKTHFSPYYDYKNPIWWSVEYGWGCNNQWDGYRGRDLNDDVKTICIQTVCQGKYSIADILHMHVDISLSFGWALTKDSFCVGGKIGRAIIPYDEISNATCGRGGARVVTRNGNEYIFHASNTVIFDGFEYRLSNFLLGVRDFIHGTQPENFIDASGVASAATLLHLMNDVTRA